MKLNDMVLITKPVPEENVEAFMLGRVVHVYEDGGATVEFLDEDGYEIGLVTEQDASVFLVVPPEGAKIVAETRVSSSSDADPVVMGRGRRTRPSEAETSYATAYSA